MIDVSHASYTVFGQSSTHTNHDRHHDDGDNVDSPSGDQSDADEAAWLESILSAGLDSVTEVKGLHSGPLVLDISQLRQETAPPSSAKKATRSGLR